MRILSSSMHDQPDRAPPNERLRGLVIKSAAMYHAFSLLLRYAEGQSTVILAGATGTGKTLLAEAIHWASARTGPFLEVTGAELAGALAEDILFGHGRGAYTGAVAPRRGLFREAAAGTLLLDDLHLMPVPMQGRLLRVLQSRRFRVSGDDRDSPLLCRVVVGLRDYPDALMREGVLLPDLRYRLGQCVVGVPALRDRAEDIPHLARAFLDQCAIETGVPGPTQIANDAMAALVNGDWPGNVRHLKSVIEVAYQNADHGKVLELHHLPEELQVALPFVPGGDRRSNDRAIAAALLRSRGNVSKAAQVLNVHRNTVTEYRRRVKGVGDVHSDGPLDCAPAQNGHTDTMDETA